MIGSDLPENLGVETFKILDLDATEDARRDMLWGPASRVFGDET
jgi:hypothetical protein